MSRNESIVLIDDSDDAADNNNSEKRYEKKTKHQNDNDNDEHHKDTNSNNNDNKSKINSPNNEKDKATPLNNDKEEERDEEKMMNRWNDDDDDENNDESSRNNNNNSTYSPNEEKAKDKNNDQQQRPPPLSQALTAAAVPKTTSTTAKRSRNPIPKAFPRNRYIRDQFDISESNEFEGKVKFTCKHCDFEKCEKQYNITRCRDHLASCTYVPRGIRLRARQTQKESLNKYINANFTISKAAELKGKTKLVCKHCPFEKTVDYFYPKVATDHLVNDCPNITNRARLEAKWKPNPNEINQVKDITLSQFDLIQSSSQQDGITSVTVVCRHCGKEKVCQRYSSRYAKKHVIEECMKIPLSIRRAAKEAHDSNNHDNDGCSTESNRKRKAEDWARDNALNFSSNFSDDSDDAGTFPKKKTSASPKVARAVENGESNRKRKQEEEEASDDDDDSAIPLKKMRQTTELAQLQVQQKKLELEGKKLEFEQKMAQVRSKVEMTYDLLEKRQKLIDQGVSLDVIDQVLPISLVNVNEEN